MRPMIGPRVFSGGRGRKVFTVHGPKAEHLLLRSIHHSLEETMQCPDCAMWFGRNEEGQSVTSEAYHQQAGARRRRLPILRSSIGPDFVRRSTASLHIVRQIVFFF